VRTRAKYTKNKSNKSHNPIFFFVETSDGKGLFYSQKHLMEQIDGTNFGLFNYGPLRRNGSAPCPIDNKLRQTGEINKWRN
jgi:hypothetical protein